MDECESRKIKINLTNLTNRQFLSHLCNYVHPLASVFIIEWLSRGCKDVIKNKEELIRENERCI